MGNFPLREEKIMLIQKGSKVIIYDKSFDIESNLIEVNSDFELEINTIMIHENYLCCVDNIYKRKDGNIIIEVYMQDAVVVKNKIIYKSIFDSE